MPSYVDAPKPEQCKTMDDVRRGVDTTDAALIELLAQRFGYMDAAARIKPRREAVRDEPRKAQVIDNVKTAAAEFKIPVQPIEQIWDRLVEASIEYELAAWDRMNVTRA